MNSALSRAKVSLIIVGNDEFLYANSPEVAPDGSSKLVARLFQFVRSDMIYLRTSVVPLNAYNYFKFLDVSKSKVTAD